MQDNTNWKTARLLIFPFIKPMFRAGNWAKQNIEENWLRCEATKVHLEGWGEHAPPPILLNNFDTVQFGASVLPNFCINNFSDPAILCFHGQTFIAHVEYELHHYLTKPAIPWRIPTRVCCEVKVRLGAKLRMCNTLLFQQQNISVWWKKENSIRL